MKDITPILQSLGFLESEIKTYLAALKNGPSTVIALTKLTNLSRQATYVAIDTLTERGLMTSVMKGKKRHYMSEDPEKLLSYAQRKEHELKDRIGELSRALPELKLRVGGDKPVVKLYEGVEGLHAILSDIGGSTTKEIREITDPSALMKVLSDKDRQVIRKKLSQTGVKLSALYAGPTPDSSFSNMDRYVLPSEFEGMTTDIVIYGDKIAFMTLEGSIYSVIIENKELADTLKKIFDLATKAL